MARADLVENDDELEKVLGTSYPKQRHIDHHPLTVSLSWLSLDVGL